MACHAVEPAKLAYRLRMQANLVQATYELRPRTSLHGTGGILPVAGPERGEAVLEVVDPLEEIGVPLRIQHLTAASRPRLET